MEPAQQPSASDVNPDVNPYAAPVAKAGEQTSHVPPIFKTWLVYALVMTAASWAISGVLGLTAYRLLIGIGAGRYWLIPLVTLAVTLPVSYLVFRWAVTRFLLANRP